jgi:hypothetical protein
VNENREMVESLNVGIAWRYSFARALYAFSRKRKKGWRPASGQPRGILFH